MAEKKNQLLKVSLVLFAILTLVYGIIYLIFPEFYVKSSGSEPIPSSWIRWTGGILIPLGIGSIMVLQKPEKQGILVAMFALGNLMVALINLYSLLFEIKGVSDPISTIIPMIISFVLAILLWLSLKQSKDILW